MYYEVRTETRELREIVETWERAKKLRPETDLGQMKIESSGQLRIGWTHTHCDSLSSWQSQKYNLRYFKTNPHENYQAGAHQDHSQKTFHIEISWLETFYNHNFCQPQERQMLQTLNKNLNLTDRLLFVVQVFVKLKKAIFDVEKYRKDFLPAPRHQSTLHCIDVVSTISNVNSELCTFLNK